MASKPIKKEINDGICHLCYTVCTLIFPRLLMKILTFFFYLEARAWTKHMHKHTNMHIHIYTRVHKDLLLLTHAAIFVSWRHVALIWCTSIYVSIEASFK